jgi:hypothetical protein
VLGLTRLECAWLSGISRGALRDLELGIGVAGEVLFRERPQLLGQALQVMPVAVVRGGLFLRGRGRVGGQDREQRVSRLAGPVSLLRADLARELLARPPGDEMTEQR